MKVKQYRKRPLEVEAIQFDGSEESANFIIEWTNGEIYSSLDPFKPYHRFVLLMDTLSGRQTCYANDYVIKDCRNRIGFLSKSVFEHTYEEKKNE